MATPAHENTWNTPPALGTSTPILLMENTLVVERVSENTNESLGLPHKTLYTHVRVKTATVENTALTLVRLAFTRKKISVETTAT
jgi:hypothetical protein